LASTNKAIAISIVISGKSAIRLHSGLAGFSLAIDSSTYTSPFRWPHSAGPHRHRQASTPTVST
jgi:hypothetical protein